MKLYTVAHQDLGIYTGQGADVRMTRKGNGYRVYAFTSKREALVKYHELKTDGIGVNRKFRLDLSQVEPPDMDADSWVQYFDTGGLIEIEIVEKLRSFTFDPDLGATA